MAEKDEDVHPPLALLIKRLNWNISHYVVPINHVDATTVTTTATQEEKMYGIVKNAMYFFVIMAEKMIVFVTTI